MRFQLVHPSQPTQAGSASGGAPLTPSPVPAPVSTDTHQTHRTPAKPRTQPRAHAPNRKVWFGQRCGHVTRPPITGRAPANERALTSHQNCKRLCELRVCVCAGGFSLLFFFAPERSYPSVVRGAQSRAPLDERSSPLPPGLLCAATDARVCAFACAGSLP